MRYLKIEPWNHIERDTPEILFNRTLDLIKRNGHYDHISPIIDYASGDSYSKRELTRYKFDFVAQVNKGGSEGIYIDCYLSGKFDDSGDEKCKVATIKSLEEGVTGFRLMGELSGLLTYYATGYISQNIDRYSSFSELEHQSRYSSVPELHERINNLFVYPSYGTTKAWVQYAWSALQKHDFNAYKQILEYLITGFEAVISKYGAETAEKIYHNIHNNPQAGVLPEELDAAALHIQRSGSLDDLRWINRNDKGGY